MSFSEIFKRSFLEGFAATDINIHTATVAMAITCGLALYIFMVYRLLTRKTFYSNGFNIALAGIALITSAIILTIQSSLVVSLGMVGALSIVRFRTAVKDPMDLMFLFWSIAVGIICGVGMAEIAVVLSVMMTAGILVLKGLPNVKPSLILVVNGTDPEGEPEILAVVGACAKHFTVKSRNMTKTSLDLVVELRTGDAGDLIRRVLEVPTVTAASLMAHDGEVTF